jgi:hypothetical protein
VAERRASPLKIPYTSVRKGKRYFEPRGRMLEHGFAARPLGPTMSGLAAPLGR